VILAALATAWYAIEILHHVRITVFQPFRMATLARGICLIFVAGRISALWRAGRWLERIRAILIAMALIGDWLLVVVTLAELAVTAAGALRAVAPRFRGDRFIEPAAVAVMLGLGINFLAHHDTEYGHIPLLAAIGAGVLLGIGAHWRRS
jgi:hypothetical protein